jgi:hypothetical protein
MKAGVEENVGSRGVGPAEGAQLELAMAAKAVGANGSQN